MKFRDNIGRYLPSLERPTNQDLSGVSVRLQKKNGKRFSLAEKKADTRSLQPLGASDYQIFRERVDNTPEQRYRVLCNTRRYLSAGRTGATAKNSTVRDASKSDKNECGAPPPG